jgi:hypothetical protein
MMADTQHAPQQGYSPDMDGPTHEGTYRGFVRFIEIGTVVVLCWVLALAVGGVKHAWTSAIIMVILSWGAAAIGAFSPGIGWRAPAAVAALLALMLIFY